MSEVRELQMPKKVKHDEERCLCIDGRRAQGGWLCKVEIPKITIFNPNTLFCSWKCPRPSFLPRAHAFGRRQQIDSHNFFPRCHSGVKELSREYSARIRNSLRLQDIALVYIRNFKSSCRREGHAGQGASRLAFILKMLPKDD